MQFIVNTARGKEVRVEAASMDVDVERSRVNFLDADGEIIASFVGTNEAYPAEGSEPPLVTPPGAGEAG